MGRRGLTASLPPLLTGLALAAVAETGAAMLLYAGEGIVRALSLILAVQVAAFGLGLLSVASTRDEELVEAIRRRWLFALIAFAAAAGYSGAWALLGGFEATPLAQGLGLTLLAGLPLFAGAGVLGEMVRAEAVARLGDPGAAARMEALAFLGAAAGFAVTGPVLLPLVSLPSIVLGCIVALSGGALLYGRSLDARTVARVVERTWSPRGEVRIEAWTRGLPRQLLKALWEDGRLRGVQDADGSPGLATERAILEGVAAWAGHPRAVLVVGGGTYTLARGLAERLRGAAVCITEENPEVTRAARAHFGLEDEGRLEIRHGGVEVGLGESSGAFGLIVVDLQARSSTAAHHPLSVGHFERLGAALREGGALILSRAQVCHGPGGLPLASRLASAREVFRTAVIYVSADAEPGEARVGDAVHAGFAVLSDAGPDGWPERLGAFMMKTEASSWGLPVAGAVHDEVGPFGSGAHGPHGRGEGRSPQELQPDEAT